jgi:hypothetical protein
MNAEIVFGCPGAGCNGTGICKVMLTAPEYTPQSGACQRIPTTISLYQNGTLRFSFLKSVLTPRIIEKQFPMQSFEVQQALTLPACITQQLSNSNALTIPAGKYRVLESSRYFFIDFR